LESSLPEPGARAVLQLLAGALERAGLDAALIGGHAANAWDSPRYTKDFDFTVRAAANAIAAFMAELQATGYRVERLQDRHGPSGPEFARLVNPATGDIVEFQGAQTPYQDLVVTRAVQPPGYMVRVATREDIIILKLIANRPIDHADIDRIVRAADEIDWPYVEHWAKEWDILDELAAIRTALGRDR
jgi:hypothetical protein